MVFVLVGELVIFNTSNGLHVTEPGQKGTVYQGTLGLDVRRNKATVVKSHIIDIDKNNEQDVVDLFYQITS